MSPKQITETLDRLTATMTRPATSRAALADAAITPRPVCTKSCTCCQGGKR